MEEQLELDGIIDHSKDKWELKITRDDFSDSPREWDNLGTICVPKNCRYVEDEAKLNDSLNWSNREEDLATLESKGYVALPLSVYDHSGVTIYIGEKCDKWDSGQVGWYIVSKERIKKEYGVERLRKKILEKTKRVLIREIKTLNAYVNGEVYGYALYQNDEEIDSCGGFFDTSNECNGFIRDMYHNMPSIFTDNFTFKQAKEMAEIV